MRLPESHRRAQSVSLALRRTAPQTSETRAAAALSPAALWRLSCPTACAPSCRLKQRTPSLWQTRAHHPPLLSPRRARAALSPVRRRSWLPLLSPALRRMRVKVAATSQATTPALTPQPARKPLCSLMSPATSPPCFPQLRTRFLARCQVVQSALASCPPSLLTCAKRTRAYSWTQRWSSVWTSRAARSVWCTTSQAHSRCTSAGRHGAPRAR